MLSPHLNPDLETERLISLFAPQQYSSLQGPSAPQHLCNVKGPQLHAEVEN